MANENLLMRMLEPAVRPVGAPAPRAAPRTPLKQQDFDALLEDAGQLVMQKASEISQIRSMEAADGAGGAMPEDSAVGQADESLNALQLMRRLGSISNISNRGLLSALPPVGRPVGGAEGAIAPID